jgi:saccharopine dehydrogenase (NAD+, L-lysine-forming)
MKAIVLGCGEMGKIAIWDLFLHGNVDEILVCVREPGKARKDLIWSENVDKIKFRLLKLESCDTLAELFSGYDVVVNCAGPNYKYEVLVARAAIDAQVNLVDLNDDYETTFEMYNLDRRAKDAGITIIMGLGASPGINNVLVRAAGDDLDEVEEIHTAWIMSAADPGGLALSRHLLYSLTGRALTVENGRLVEVRSFIDGRERLYFPKPVGPMDVYHVGHPEPITLLRKYNDALYIDDKASFNPPSINQLIMSLGEEVRNSPRSPDAMDLAAVRLLEACREIRDVPLDGALRIEVKGRKNGKGLRIIYTGAGRITYGTGIPASIGAKMLMKGKVKHKGVQAPEECIDPQDFLEEILNRGFGELEEERIAY